MKADHDSIGDSANVSTEGLARVPDATLRRVLELIRRDPSPRSLTTQALRAEGIPHASTLIACLHGLEPSAQARTLSLILAERASRTAPSLRVVWTGPEAHTATARDTSILLQELFARAEQSVFLAGFRFDNGKRILSPLHRAMREHNVAVSVFADLRRSDQDSRTLDEMLSDFRAHFLRDNWPFGQPFPRVYYDPRQAHPYVSLHAKCAIVDHRHTLITSANFTDRGLSRNIELGVLIDEPDFAEQVEAQWLGLVNAGLVVSLAIE